MGAGKKGSECSLIGNPINVINGNKFQEEVDTDAGAKIGFSRYYNSLTGLWRHSFSRKLNRLANDQMMLTRDDGAKTKFSKAGNLWLEQAGSETLEYDGKHYVHSEKGGDKSIFDSDGHLVRLIRSDGWISIEIKPFERLTITHQNGERLLLVEDKLRQPQTMTTANVVMAYRYDSKYRLIEARRNMGSHALYRRYHYTDAHNPKLLTGITDERGIRYATWTYDDQGRAVSSEHANGAEKITLRFNTDGSTTVTNALGKQTVYRFQAFQGVPRITAIEGEPSANCPASNSKYAYDERGLLKTKTDNKGNHTTYEYNTRGLEISRTEASGTPQARTITTEWHPDFFAPVKITEPDRITQYTYDSQGRQTSQSIIQR